MLQIIGTYQIGGKNIDMKQNTFQKLFNKFLWLVGISRNAICVVTCGFIGYRFSVNGEPPFQVIGFIPSGIPEFKLPPFGYSEVVNGTKIDHSFGEMFANIGCGVLVVTLIALLESIAVCKAFCKYYYSIIPDKGNTFCKCVLWYS